MTLSFIPEVIRHRRIFHNLQNTNHCLCCWYCFNINFSNLKSANYFLCQCYKKKCLANFVFLRIACDYSSIFVSDWYKIWTFLKWEWVHSRIIAPSLLDHFLFIFPIFTKMYFFHPFTRVTLITQQFFFCAQVKNTLLQRPLFYQEVKKKLHVENFLLVFRVF